MSDLNRTESVKFLKYHHHLVHVVERIYEKKVGIHPFNISSKLTIKPGFQPKIKDICSACISAAMISDVNAF